ncbi:group I truncated hemoglobin [Fictibacillus terranigra]|uniref:Group 1 truncated hemoglobin n=1 Tax=Fictibacillus terranigra TaxID=3058424 RepID=A0ABT8ECF0_9BACL|nr:group 1 truncated hemoglobin [Fictibacillus sp. CENA-BCM004]MDN4075623.1 group 1 truncated hemoglobin [Fictibacillus sp. CENA-BCM004]
MQESLYEKLGGRDSIEKVVDSFYEKVLADPVVNHFFEHTNMDKQRKHQTKFLSYALGGPNQYSGTSMAKVHENMNLQPEHFTAIVHHLKEALEEFRVPNEDINAAVKHVNTLRDDILYK